jgi:hypothetical protein
MVTKASATAAADELRLVSTQWERYVRARDYGHMKYVELAKKCDEFYIGNQWDPRDVKGLGSRPWLTINEILPTVNAVMAEQSSRRMDVMFKPTRGGSQEVANVLNKVFEHISHVNKLEWVEQTVFADGLIMDGRGYFDVRMDYKHNTQGDVKIKALDPLDVLLDPDAKDADPRSWNEVITTRWATFDDIEIAYGKKKAESLRSVAENGTTWGEDSIEWREERFGSSENNTAPAMNTWGKDDFRNIRRLRLLERQYYKMASVNYFVDDRTGDQKKVPEGWDDKKAIKFAKLFGLSVVTQMQKRVRWTVTCDKVLLHDDWSPYNHFTVVPFFCYFRRGRPFGMVRNLISSQEQLNKVSSQELHIVNTTANSGWIVENGSLSTLKPEELEQVGAQTGLVVEYNRGFTPPVKILPNQVPTGLDRIGQKAQANIKTISGVNDAMLQGDAKDADLANPMKMVQQNRGTIMAQVPLDNLAKCRHYLAEIVLDCIQNFYTEERVLQITNDNDPTHPREEITINGMTPEGFIVNDVTTGKYDVMVTTVPARDTFDDVQFLEAMALRTVGIHVPDDAVVEYSHLARKGELAKRIRQETGVDKSPEQQQMEMMMQQMQIQAAQLGVLELQGKVEKLKSEAALNMAKAQDTSQIAPQIALAELQAELQTRMKELETRKELARLSAEARDKQTETGAAVKVATTAMSTAARREQAAEKAKIGATKPNVKK